MQTKYPQSPLWCGFKGIFKVSQKPINILVDYIAFTIGRECFIDSVDNPEYEDETDKGILDLLCLVMGFGELEFVQRRGLYGYDIAYCHEGITLCWGGTDTIFVQMSGQGCRLYETINKSLDWLSMIRMVQGFRRHNFSRLDIACDTFGRLKMDTLMQFTAQQRYVSRFQDYEIRYGTKMREIIFGSPKSRVLLRIYDKTMERKVALGGSAQVAPDWLRLELQMRDDAADSFIAAWRRTNNISTAYYGILSNQLRFVRERDPITVTRSVTVKWWSTFCGHVDKIPMAYKGGLEYNLQSLQRYVIGQAGSSIRTWLELHDYDTAALIELVKERKYNERQKALLDKVAAVDIDSISASR